MRIDDPWRDVHTCGVGGAEPPPPAARPAPVPGPREPSAERTSAREADDAQAAVYLAVHRSPAFREVRDRYRRFVLPATLAFLLWYFGYVVAATALPGVMARPVAGVLNVGMLAGLGQFASTFLLTWAYARHARLRRDRLALELRWETQEMTRGAGQVRERREALR
ncbi:DUF485 domain-containing protein [Streptomyces sp. HNM0574]|uniref:DUF485 domain-containing protein n=1 Tax=Streptomyces sp. HNM0574 TaxID=2714954 RepID=UPI00146BB0C9|nr:DUF485 domain-containing protein [Streptomyces sp. HNM0574]NLU65734.1 DUF485 domain-containing protein [Streptomyces sp. HNM0574]